MSHGSALSESGKVRVLIFASDCAQGSGAFRCAVGLAKTLRECKGYDAFVVTGRRGDGEALLEELGIPYWCVPSGGWAISKKDEARKVARVVMASWLHSHVAILKLARLIERLRVDLVHCNTIFSYTGCLAARIAKVPVVWHIREYIDEGIKFKIVNQRRGHELIGESAAIMCVSDWIRRKYSHILPENRLHVIHDGVDPARFYIQKHDIMTSKPYMFICVGSYRKYKGYDALARAAVKLYQSGFKDFRILFVGGKVEENLNHIFRDGGCAHIVEYAGFQKEPVSFLRQADIAFTCCRAEAFGLVTVEAMMAGCCVLGINAAATPELIEDGKTGLLFEDPKQNEDSLVEKMRYAIEHPDEIRRMAAAGQAYMIKNMTLENNALKVADIYSDVLKGSGR